jgi:hypothetical protein
MNRDLVLEIRSPLCLSKAVPGPACELPTAPGQKSKHRGGALQTQGFKWIKVEKPEWREGSGTLEVEMNIPRNSEVRKYLNVNAAECWLLTPVNPNYLGG